MSATQGIVSVLAKLSSTDLDLIKRFCENQISVNAANGRGDVHPFIAAANMSPTFVVGQPVWFDAKTRGIIRGKVVKINAKTIRVLSSTGVKWKCSPSLVRPGVPA